MLKEYDNFVELSLAEEELISGGFVRKLLRATKKVVKPLGTVVRVAGRLLGGSTIFSPTQIHSKR